MDIRFLVCSLNYIFSLSRTVVMAGVIELFCTIKSFYKSMGLYPNHKKCLISAKNIFLSISIIQLFITSSAYLLFQAKTSDEYGISFYISITLLSVMVNISNTAWKIDKILTLIGKYEKFIENS